MSAAVKRAHSGVFTKERRLGVIVSSWHADLVGVCKDALYSELKKLGENVTSNVTLVHVPGALEFPLTAKLMAETGEYAAIAVIALVVDGGIYRHDFVASTVIDGISRVSVETRVPILSASLTPQHFHEHKVHHDFFKNHLVLKGQELAHACVKIVKILDGIRNK